MKRVLGLMVILATMFSLVACGGDDLIGSWELKNDSEIKMTTSYVFDEDTLTINGLSFPYKVKGSKIIINFIEGEDSEWKYEIEGNLLTMSTKTDIVELKKVK